MVKLIEKNTTTAYLRAISDKIKETTIFHLRIKQHILQNARYDMEVKNFWKQ